MGRRPKMPGNMGNMMKQAQKMQKQMQKMQSDIEKQEFEASAGGGAITAQVNGKKEVLSINLDEAIVDPEDIEMLEDLIVAAVNSAMEKADKAMEKQMGKLTGGLNIPGLF